MLSNYHTHTVYCDGKNTAREMVLKSIELGYSSLGFSAHGYTPYDERYCIKDLDGYVKEITSLKEEFKSKIEIYLGLEEDAFSLADRTMFDYIIGSCHYYNYLDNFYPIDSSKETFIKCIEVFNGDAIKMATEYYEKFCSYILARKPDIIGHFDLITKYDEILHPMFLNNIDYLKLSEKYLKVALKADSIFEVNCGAIIKNYRTKPYPYENLLSTINKEGGKICLSLDAHGVDALAFDLSEIKNVLKNVGFNGVYTLKSGKFVKESL